MPYRRIIFSDHEVYHVLNRGVGGSPVYNSTREYSRFVQLLDFYRHDTSPLSFSHFARLSTEEQNLFLQKKEQRKARVEILAYSLMPNHFHLVIKQLEDGGIQKYLANVQNGYVRYFNKRNKRKGPLFESTFKAIRMETEEQLLHTTRYIHLNSSTAYIVSPEDLKSYAWSSFPDYLGSRQSFVSTNMILEMVGGIKKHENFVLDQADYQRTLDKIKHLLLEEI